MVRAEEIDNQERGRELVDREGRRIDVRTQSDPPAASAAEAPEVAELRALRERVKAAQLEATILAADKAPHCRDCFLRGWRAALRAIEG